MSEQVNKLDDTVFCLKRAIKSLEKDEVGSALYQLMDRPYVSGMVELNLQKCERKIVQHIDEGTISKDDLAKSLKSVIEDVSDEIKRLE